VTASSRGESTNHRFRRRFHGLEITKEKQRVSEALARVDAQREKLTGQLGTLRPAIWHGVCGDTSPSKSGSASRRSE
jgi:hypothetical protein